MRKRTCDEIGKVCPVCGYNCIRSGYCEHVVTILCHDTDGSDVVAPLYFGLGLMSDEFDELFNAIAGFAFKWLKGDQQQRSTLAERVADAPPELQNLLKGAINAVEDPMFEFGDVTDDEEEWVCYECREGLRKEFETLFKSLYQEQPSAIRSECWTVCQPMVSWSGETFWAKEAQECAEGITQRAEALAAAIQEFADGK